MIGGIGFGKIGKLAAVPFEASGIYDDAADGSAVPADIFVAEATMISNAVFERTCQTYTYCIIYNKRIPTW